MIILYQSVFDEKFLWKYSKQLENNYDHIQASLFDTQ